MRAGKNDEGDAEGHYGVREGHPARSDFTPLQGHRPGSVFWSHP